MWDPISILPKFFLGNSAVVLGVFDKNQENSGILALWVKKVKSDFIPQDFKEFESIKAFCEYSASQDLQEPILLNIDDSRVIIEQGEDGLNMFDDEEFFIQTSDDFDIHGMIRRSEVDRLLDEFEGLKGSVVSVQLGMVNTLQWAASLELESPWRIGRREINSTGETLGVQASSDKSPVELEGQSFSPLKLQLFFVSLEYFLTQELTDVSVVSTNYREKVFQNTFERSLLVGGVFLFLIFLMSTSFFFYLGAENDKLSEDFYEQNILQQKADRYATEISRLEGVLDVENRYPAFSRISDDMGKLVPKTISLKELKIYPVDLSEMKRKKAIDTDPSLEIVGESRTMNEVSQWVTSIKDLVWVQDISNEINKVERGYRINIKVTVSDVE